MLMPSIVIYTLSLHDALPIWILASFFNIDKEHLAKGFKRPLLWLSYAFFFLTCFSALFSSIYEGALFAVEIKFIFVDRKNTLLNSSHLVISYAILCLYKKYNF